MPDKLTISDIQKCIHPVEKRNYWLAVGIVLPIMLIILVNKIELVLVIPGIVFSAWLIMRITRAHLLGSCAKVSPDNFPEVYSELEHMRQILDYQKKVEVYVYQDGEVNAFLLRRFRTSIIMLPHELVADMQIGESRKELTWILARAVGHLKAKHLNLWWLNLLIESFERLQFLNIFFYPWERAVQYSGDRIGMAVCRDLDAAVMALKKLMVGNELASKATLVGALQQRNHLNGSFFSWLAECFSTHPHLTKRVESLINWTKTYNLYWYECFMNKQPDRKRVEELLRFANSAPMFPGNIHVQSARTGDAQNGSSDREISSATLDGYPDPEADYRALYNEFILARKLCNEPLNGLTFEKFQRALRVKIEKIKSGSANVQFAVDTSTGKAKIKLINNLTHFDPLLLSSNKH